MPRFHIGYEAREHLTSVSLEVVLEEINHREDSSYDISIGLDANGRNSIMRTHKIAVVVTSASRQQALATFLAGASLPPNFDLRDLTMVELPEEATA
jgi:hypothetical protein